MRAGWCGHHSSPRIRERSRLFITFVIKPWPSLATRRNMLRCNYLGSAPVRNLCLLFPPDSSKLGFGVKKRPSAPKDWRAFLAQFRSDENCYDFLFNLRVGREFQCFRPDCDCKSFGIMRRAAGGRGWKKRFRVCTRCRSQESGTTGTLLHRTRLSLQDWFKVFWLAAGATDGFDFNYLRQERIQKLGVIFGSLRTPFRVVAAVRAAMAYSPKLSGRIHFGLTTMPRPQSRHRGQRIVGILVDMQKHRLKVAVLPDTSVGALTSFLATSVTPESIVSTSGWRGFDCVEHVCSHVRETSIPPSSDNPFSNLPEICSVANQLAQWFARFEWYGINKRNLPGYLDEFTFRFDESRRGSTQGLRFVRLLRRALSIQASAG